MRVSLGMRVGTVAVATGVALSMTAAPAGAALTASSYWYKSCTAGGFTGYARVLYDQSTKRVYEVAYAIKKGTNQGGNSANVEWIDGGVAPTLSSATGSGIQDGAYHVLRSADYSRGYGGTSMNFTFDKTNASDPSCGVTAVIS